MPQECPLTLRRSDQKRTEFALIEGHLEIIAVRLARRPTRGDLALTALGIIFCTAVVTTLFVWIAWHWRAAIIVAVIVALSTPVKANGRPSPTRLAKDHWERKACVH
jgi:hypothetical protein